MKKFKNRQRPRRKYIFDILGHKKALKISWDSPFKYKFVRIKSEISGLAEVESASFFLIR